jgi:hypothetical protein
VGVIKRNGEVSCVRILSQEDKLILRADLKVRLEVRGVQIAKTAVTSPPPERDGITGVIEIGEEVTGRKLVTGE